MNSIQKSHPTNQPTTLVEVRSFVDCFAPSFCVICEDHDLMLSFPFQGIAISIQQCG
jgi:hypothetical protein